MNGMQMGPPSGGDAIGTLIVIAGALATVYVFVVAIWVSVKPGEMDERHPKYHILRDDR